jgi:hypothetical protein
MSGGDCHSPVRSVGDSVALEGLDILELLAACSCCSWSTESDRLVLHRCLDDYQARLSPSGAGSREEEERRWWIGCGVLRDPFSFVEHLLVLVMQ